MVCEVERGQRFTAQGEVRLVGAHIGGYLRLNGAHLTNPSREALSADRLRVDQDMVCGACKDGQRFTAQGEVRLVGAHIGGQLSFNGAELSGSPTALTLSEAQVASSLWLRLHGEDPPKGAVDLRRARAGAIHDRAYCRPQTWPMTFLEDCRYESLESDPAVDVKTRLKWLREDPGGYSPQPYEQLNQVFRLAGDVKSARRVAIAKQRRRRRRLAPQERALSYVFDAVAGYGYRTSRAVYALVVIAVIGWPIFAWASWDHLTETRPDGQRPPFQPWLYSIDAVLPVINLGQESAWAATGAAQIWYALSVLAGWLLSFGLIAALTATLFRE
jgi:hypothetical protein